MPQNLKDLATSLQQSWLNLDQEYVNTLVDSMPRRITSVIQSNGRQNACQHIITIYIILNALGKLLQHNIHGILPQLNEYSNILADPVYYEDKEDLYL